MVVAYRARAGATGQTLPAGIVRLRPRDPGGSAPVMRNLRTLTPLRLTDSRLVSANQRVWRAAVFIALSAVIVQFAISANTLADLGVRYAEPGGNPLVKFHPGTYLTALAAMIVLLCSRPAGMPLIRLFRVTPALAMFNVLILGCSLYSIVN